jgi:hypothetical protein
MPYLAKYITKDYAEHETNEKRYWTGRGIAVPERMSIGHILADDPAEALKIAFGAALQVGASLDRCQVFW